MTKNSKKRQGPQLQSPEHLNITRDVLANLSARELRRVHQLASEILQEDETDEMNDDDVALVYDVRLLTKNGTAFRNKGRVPLTSILNHRLLAEAPARLEMAFVHSIQSPVSAAAFDLFDKHNPTQNSTHLLENGYSDDLRGLPEPDPTNIG